MPSPAFEKSVRAAAAHRHHDLAVDIRRLREDAGLSSAARARGGRRSQLPPAHRGPLEPPDEDVPRRYPRPSVDVPAARLGAGRGPRHAALPEHRATSPRPAPGQMPELVLAARHPRWTPFTEVAVRHRRAAGSISPCTIGRPASSSPRSCSPSSAASNSSSAGPPRRASLSSWDGWARSAMNRRSAGCSLSDGHAPRARSRQRSRAAAARLPRPPRGRARGDHRGRCLAGPRDGVGRSGRLPLAPRLGSMSARRDQRPRWWAVST